MKSLIILCLSILLLSCSRVEVAMNWADTYTAAEADKYFDTTSAQSKMLKASIQKDLVRLKRELFPQLANYLRRVDTELQKGTPSKEIYLKYLKEGTDGFHRIEPYFSGTAADFMATVTPAQLEHLEKVVREKNKEDQEKVENSKKAREETRKKYLRWTDLWIGSLSEEQEKLLDEHLQAHPFPFALQIKNKEYRLQKLKEACKSPETLKAFAKYYVEHNDEILDPEYATALHAYQKQVDDLGYKILQTLTAKQKKSVHENLQEKISSLERLSKD